MRFPTTAVAALLLASTAQAQSPITVDALFDDWCGFSAVWNDNTGQGGTDFVSLTLAHDDRFLYLLVETDDELDLSENNNVEILLDTDNNANTGFSAGGIGAELRWQAGDRNGTFHVNGQTTVFHDDIRFRAAPTVTSTLHEIAIGRDTFPDGSNPLFTGNTVRVLIRDGNNGDRMPDAGQTISYSLNGSTNPIVPIPLDRSDPNDLRIATHNVLNDSLSDSQTDDSFRRLYQATQPDILHLQEVYNQNASSVDSLITSWLGGTWHAAGVNDCKTVSRFPILGSWAIDGNLAVLLDTSSSIGTPMLCINAHLPCCSNDNGRQEESDNIIAFIRDARQPGNGPVDIGPEVPVMIAGDLNLVGFSQQLDTLLTGDIIDTGSFGPDAAPDGDGSPLACVSPRQTEKQVAYTWRNDNSSFWPGQLDFMMYSNSRLVTTNEYSIYTPEMSAAVRSQHGLQTNDSLASDHLLVIADFTLGCEFGGDPETTDIDDLLGFLGPWFSGDAAADVNGDSEVDIQDLLRFLSCWFAQSGTPANCN